MAKKYNKAPIVEALCEFEFEPGTPWDLTMPGLIYQRLSDTFPKKQQLRQIGVGVTQRSGQLEQQIHTEERVRFLNKDEKNLVQVGPKRVSIHRLSPYLSWHSFSPLIKMGYEAYRDVVGSQALNRVSLRYINTIEFDEKRIKIEDYFSFYPYVGADLPQEFGPFIAGIRASRAEGRDVLKLVVTRDEMIKPEVLSVSLDIEYYLRESTQLSQDDVLSWVEEAHEEIESTFEASITDKLRLRFDAEVV